MQFGRRSGTTECGADRHYRIDVDELPSRSSISRCLNSNFETDPHAFIKAIVYSSLNKIR